jgi:hypothetical protein
MTDYSKYPSDQQARDSFTDGEFAEAVMNLDPKVATKNVVTLSGSTHSAATFRALYDLADTFGKDAVVDHSSYQTSVVVPMTVAEREEYVTVQRKQDLWRKIQEDDAALQALRDRLSPDSENLEPGTVVNK